MELPKPVVYETSGDRDLLSQIEVLPKISRIHDRLAGLV